MIDNADFIDKRSECRDRACSGMTERAQSSKGSIPFILYDCILNFDTSSNRVSIEFLFFLLMLFTSFIALLI